MHRTLSPPLFQLLNHYHFSVAQAKALNDMSRSTEINTASISLYKKKEKKCVLYQQGIVRHTILCKSICLSLYLFSISCQPGPETFLRCLADIKEALCGDIPIQETCWHSYQTSKSLVSFWKGLMRVMEMLKGVLAPNITKGWEDMNTLLTQRLKAQMVKKEKKEKHWNAFSREWGGGGGDALVSISA